MQKISRNKKDKAFLVEEKYITRIYVSLVGLIATGSVLVFFTPTTILRVIELIFSSVIAVSLYRLKRIHALKRYDGFNHILFVALSICLVQILARGDWTQKEFKDILLYFLNYNYCLPYLIPFVVLYIPNNRHIKRICEIFFWGTLLTIPIWFINIENLIGETFEGESIGAYLPFFGCFLLAYPAKLPFKKKIILWSICLIYLFLMVLNARRNMIFSICFYFFIAYYVNISKHIKIAIVRIIFNIILLPSFVYITFQYLSDPSNNYFHRLNERVYEDTRSSVETMFWLDHFNSSSFERYMGKGTNGSYYYKSIDMETGEVSTERYVIETGYLQMILKGGYIYLGIFIIILILCFIKSFKIRGPEGVFLRLVILLYCVDSYSTNTICYFSTRAIIFWLVVNLTLNYSQKDEQNRWK